VTVKITCTVALRGGYVELRHTPHGAPSGDANDVFGITTPQGTPRETVENMKLLREWVKARFTKEAQKAVADA
jgi:hypothetical protein